MVTLASVSNTYALDIALKTPSHVNLNESFIVTIEVESSDTYDVKLYVEDQQKIVSQIFANTWKSSFYYLPAVFPSQKSYQVRVTVPTTDPQLCIRLRKTGSKTALTPYCQPIMIDSEKIESSPQELPTEDEPIHLSNSLEQTIYTKEYRVKQVTALLFLVISSFLIFKIIKSSLQS